MKKITLLFILFCLPKLMAQNATLASGGNATGSGGSSSYSVGQLVYTNQVGSNGSTNQGVQQPIEIFALGTNDFPEITLTMSVYPNPTSDNITISTNKINAVLNIEIIDVLGRVVQSEKTTNNVSTLKLEVSEGVYYIRIHDADILVLSQKLVVVKP